MSKERLIDLDAKQLALVKDILKKHIPYKTVWAYGSRVNWKAGEHSDLDIVVFDSELGEIAELKDEFAESELLISVDVMDWETIPDNFKTNIKKKYAVLQEESKHHKWHEVRLGDIAEVVTGKTPPTKNVWLFGDKYPFITPTDISDFSRFCNPDRFLSDEGAEQQRQLLIPTGAICFTCIASIGKICLTQEDSFTNQQINSLKPHTNIVNNEFLFYRLKYDTPQLREYAGGTVTNIIKKTLFESFKIPLPPLPEQKAIAKVLSSLDDKIDLLHRQNKTLETLAQTLFRKWFTDNPDRHNWERKKLLSTYKFEKGIEPGSNYYQDTKTHNNIRFTRIRDMQDSAGKVFIDKSLFKANCNETDILVSFDGTVGRIAFGRVGTYSSGIRKIYSPNKTYDNLGLKYLLFKSKDIQNTINEHASGTTILHAGSSIDFLSFAFPEEAVIQKFNKLTDPLFAKILTNQSEAITLGNIRDTLLPKLISGDVGVKA